MKLIIVRHGESELNLEGTTVQGQIDSLLLSRTGTKQTGKTTLSQTGIKQAEKTAESLKDTHIDCAYISPLARAKQTAEIILQYHPQTKIIFDDQLKERSFGKYEGGSRKKYHEDIKKSGVGYVDFKPEGGETWYEAGERFVEFYEKNILLKHINTSDTILIVAHSTVLMYLLLWLDGKAKKPMDTMFHYDAYHPDNASVSMIEVDKTGKNKLVTLNDTSHLEK